VYELATAPESLSWARRLIIAFGVGRWRRSRCARFNRQSGLVIESADRNIERLGGEFELRLIGIKIPQVRSAEARSRLAMRDRSGKVRGNRTHIKDEDFGQQIETMHEVFVGSQNFGKGVERGIR